MHMRVYISMEFSLQPTLVSLIQWGCSTRWLASGDSCTISPTCINQNIVGFKQTPMRDFWRRVSQTHFGAMVQMKLYASVATSIAYCVLGVKNAIKASSTRFCERAVRCCLCTIMHMSWRRDKQFNYNYIFKARHSNPTLSWSSYGC